MMRNILMMSLVLLGLVIFGSVASAQCQLAEFVGAVPGHDFGGAAATSEDWLVVGEPLSDEAGSGAGAVRLYRRVGAGWVQEAVLTSSDAAVGDRFGESVAIDGDVLVVGASGNDDDGSNSGSSYVFAFDGVAWAEEAKLTALDAAAGDSFGAAVAVSANRVAVGSAFDDDAGSSSGSLYLFEETGGAWGQSTKLTAADAAAGDEFGTALSMSDGVIAVTSPHDNSVGACYVFRLNAAVWQQEEKLTANDGAAGDLFGASVSVVGDVVAVGAPDDDDLGVASGSAYVFRFNTVTWQQEAKLTAGAAGDEFGQALAASTDTILVGSPRSDVGGVDAGVAHFFRFDGIAWTSADVVSGGSTVAGDRFGATVALGEGGGLVGTTLGSGGVGVVYLFGAYLPDCDDNGIADACDLLAGTSVDCNHNQIPDSCDLLNATSDDCDGNGIPDECDVVFLSEETKINASDGDASDRFGSSVSIDGEVVAVGATHAGSPVAGAVYVYRRGATSWLEEQILTASDGAHGDQLGWTSDVDGDVVVAGAYNHGGAMGAAYVFRHNGVAWSEEQKLTPSDGASDDNFGTAVAVDESVVVVGSWRDDDAGSSSGSAYVFRHNGMAWLEEAKLTASDASAGANYGRAVAISGNRIVVGAFGDDVLGSDVGAAYVYVYTGTAWIEEAKLVASDFGVQDTFGLGVAIHGDRIAVGAPGDDDLATSSGAAYLFSFDGVTWVEDVKIRASNGAAGDRFGSVVAVAGDTLIVGADDAHAAGEDSGSAYHYRYDGVSWIEEELILGSDVAPFDVFGYAVAVDDGRAVIGSIRDDDGGSNSGSAYVFERRSDCNGNGLLDECEITGPEIVEQPSAATVCVDDSVAFTVAAVGGSPLHYEWRHNGTVIPGATGPSHMIATASAADAGNYRVVVSDPCGAVASDVVVLAVENDCETHFVRGDCNADGGFDIADAVRALNLLFPNPPPAIPVPCTNACDCNDDEVVNIADAVCMLTGLFGNPSVPPPSPHPTCGADPTTGGLDCVEYLGCAP